MTWHRFPEVQLVADAHEGAEVLYDFNAGPGHVLADGWTLGVPQMTGDPDAVGVEFSWRQLAFTHHVTGRKLDAVAQLNQLGRVLLRRRAWLRFRLSGETAPVWFRTYRTLPEALSFDQVYVERDGASPKLGDTWGIGVRLTADPWAYGEEVTLPTATLLESAAGAVAPPYAGRYSYWLPAIRGDVATPLCVRVSCAPASSTGFVYSVRPSRIATTPWSSETAAAARFWASGMTAAPGQTVYKGPTPSAVAPGTYMVYAQAGGAMRIGQSFDGGANITWNATPTDLRVKDRAGDTWADLGRLTVRGVAGSTAPVTPYIAFDSLAAGGTVPPMLLVPLYDDRVEEPATLMNHISVPSIYGEGTSSNSGDGIGPDSFVLCGAEESRVERARPAGTLTLPITIEGATDLMATPGRANLLSAIVGTNDSRGPVQVDVSYRPRYLNLAGQ